VAVRPAIRWKLGGTSSSATRTGMRWASLLPNVNPTFNWVRLAQRIPVRVALDEIPPDFHLIAGRTATVSVLDDKPSAHAGEASAGGHS